MLGLWEPYIDGTSMLSGLTNVNTIDLDFDFDGEVLGSQPYRSAHRSNLRIRMMSVGASATERAVRQEASSSVRHHSALPTLAESPSSGDTLIIAASGNTFKRSFKEFWLPRTHGPQTEASRRHREIEDQLRLDREKADRITKVLILGTSQSGKTTLLKSTMLHTGGSYTHEQKVSFGDVILRNMVHDTCYALETLEVPPDYWTRHLDRSP